MSRPVHVLKDRYELHRKIARGGMAEVFLARDRVLDRPVAVKIMFPEFATDPTFVERFRREAQSAAKLSHPNIVGVYDWGEERGTYFLVMEYINGPSVSEVLRRDGPFPPRRAAEIAADVASALGAAHEVGVIHRDIKPGNIMLAADGRAKVTDFGIARMAHDPDNELTKVGSVMGTATYFSPEQAQGFPLDGRSDLYSLGAVLFEMLTGRPPFAAETPVAIAYKHVQERPPRPASIVSGIPLAIEAITLRLLTKNPDSRYDNAAQLSADLRRFRMGQPTVAEMALQRSGPPDSPPTEAVTAATAGAAATAAAVATRNGVGAADPPDDYDDPEDDERRNRTPVYAAVLVAMVVLLVGLALLLRNSLSTDDGADPVLVEVPQVAGEPQADADAALKKAGFKTTVEERADAAVGAGRVIGTNPQGGDQAAKGSSIKMIVSSGAPKSQVPRLIDLTQAEAQAKLTADGFTNVRINPVEDSEAEPGIVVDQDPPPLTPALTDQLITLSVAATPEDVEIPDVSGQSESSATKELTGAGFVVASVSTRADNSQPAGRAIGTDPSGSAPTGTELKLIMSSGPETVTVPQVNGLSEATAKERLAAKGLVPKIVTAELPVGDSRDGTVIDVSPTSGESVPPGSTITLTIGYARSAPTTVTTAPTTTAPATTASSTTAPATTSP